MKNLLLIGTVLLSGAALAGQRVTLEDGRQVELNDDFTWQYVVDEAVKQPSADLPVDRVPVVAKSAAAIDTGTLLEVGSNKNTLQLSGSGVDILLGKSAYTSGALVIPTSVTNQGVADIISVVVKVTVQDRNGNTLFAEDVAVWKSIKRMADTYLRPKSSREGRTIKVQVPELKSYLIHASVTEVEFR